VNHGSAFAATWARAFSRTGFVRPTPGCVKPAELTCSVICTAHVSPAVAAVAVAGAGASTVAAPAHGACTAVPVSNSAPATVAKARLRRLPASRVDGLSAVVVIRLLLVEVRAPSLAPEQRLDPGVEPL
jgi:hypothetical protein